ncbi:shikimate kinase [Virgibacillus kimchii]
MHEEKSIVLIGFMGVGKSTLGKELANRLRRNFIDIDQEIEKMYGMETTKIFKVHGEEAFRQKEQELSIYYAKQPGYIISLGGGAFMNEAIRHLCLSHCVIIYLDLSWEYWKDRISILVDSRPILQQKNMEEIRELFQERKTLYLNHHIKINMDELNIEDSVQAVMEAMEKLDKKQ